MKTSLLSISAPMLSFTMFSTNQAQAGSGGYVFKCGLKATVIYTNDQIISVSVEDFKSGIITKGKSSVALFDTKANKSYELGCSQKFYTTTNRL